MRDFWPESYNTYSDSVTGGHVRTAGNGLGRVQSTTSDSLIWEAIYQAAKQQIAAHQQARRIDLPKAA